MTRTTWALTVRMSKAFLGQISMYRFYSSVKESQNFEKKVVKTYLPTCFSSHCSRRRDRWKRHPPRLCPLVQPQLHPAIPSDLSTDPHDPHRASHCRFQDNFLAGWRGHPPCPVRLHGGPRRAFIPGAGSIGRPEGTMELSQSFQFSYRNLKRFVA